MWMFCICFEGGFKGCDFVEQRHYKSLQCVIKKRLTPPPAFKRVAQNFQKGGPKLSKEWLNTFKRVAQHFQKGGSKLSKDGLKLSKGWLKKREINLMVPGFSQLNAIKPFCHLSCCKE